MRCVVSCQNALNSCLSPCHSAFPLLNAVEWFNVCVHMSLALSKQRLAAGCSLIRLQKWVCLLSPLSPACLPLPLSVSLAFFSLSPYWLQRPVVCVIQSSSSGSTTQHPSLVLSCSPFLSSCLSLSHLHCTPYRRLGGMWLSPLTSMSAEHWPTSRPPLWCSSSGPGRALLRCCHS